MIKKVNSGYAVYNESGTRKLSRTYPTKEQAQKRLAQIEYFKNKK